MQEQEKVAIMMLRYQSGSDDKPEADIQGRFTLRFRADLDRVGRISAA